MSRILLLSLALLLASCATTKQNSNATAAKMPFVWENANLYFLLTDRFNNGNPANDLNFNRTDQTAPLRGFMGGDIAGITKKIEEGYFDKLGITALWFTPVVEQIHGSTDEGTGVTYGFHGYWAKDWTALDPNFGAEKDLTKLIETAHRHGIRIVLDVVLNHTGPVTAADPVWPADWVRTEPACTYKNYETTTACTLVKNLPDIRTESNKAVALPPALVEKWKAEGRYEKEVAELDAFFARTGYPRAAKYYIIKWLTDYIRKYGVDGFRCDTAKHLEESVWADLRKEADLAFADWKKANPKKVLDANPFYMVGEVYFYNANNGRSYDFGDKKVDYFNNGFSSLINFGIKGDATADYETLFSKYSKLLQKQLAGKTVLNYMTSHDDGEPFDKMRAKPFETGTKLLLCPGGAQIYYGDETARPLTFEGAQGDANLRTFMNWDDLKNNAVRNGANVREVLAHWQKLGQFRRAHPAVGAGVHEMLSAKPYVFKRTYEQGKRTDIVIVGLDQPKGPKSIDLRGLYPEGMTLTDYYSGSKIKVTGGKATLNTPFEIVLLGK